MLNWFWRWHSLLFVVFLGSTGCNTVASTLGFQPPVHKLTATADQLRTAGIEPQAIPKELDKTVLASYIVEPGDTLAVEMVELDSPIRLPGNQPVLLDGTIDLGKFGRPMVAYKTLPQIELDVRRVIESQIKDPKEKAASAVSVRLIGRESKVFYVLGEVNAPRAYPLTGRETVLDGILVAGGLTRQANSKKIILSRPSRQDSCRTVLPVCYDQIVQLGDTSTNYQLQPGDRIYVPSQSPFDGLFFFKSNKPGPCMNPQTGCATGDCNTCPVPALAPTAPEISVGMSVAR